MVPAAISIRGMQLNDVEKSFDPAVAVYLDGVYLATTTGALINVWDAEGVEVLRGPQGTLFGRNTIGGLLHVKRKEPTGEFGGRVSATYGSFDRLDVNAAIDLPAFANDTISVRAMVNSKNGGGYFKNLTRNTDEGEADYLGFNLTAKFEPSDRFKMLARFDYIDDNTPTLPVTLQTTNNELFAVLFNSVGRPVTDGDYHRSPLTSNEQEASLETVAVTLSPTYRLNENHRLEGIFAYRDTKEEALNEFDGDARLLFETSRPTEDSQLSGEIRLHSDWADGRVQSVLGGYYWESEYEIAQTTRTALFPAFISSAHPSFAQETQSLALFGQVDFDVTDKLGLSVGGRYIDETKKACGANGLTFAGSNSVTTVSTYGFEGVGLCDSGNPAYNNTGVDAQNNPLTVTGKESWSKFTPRVGVTYDAGNALLYATYSKGFRSGGFNGRSTAHATFGPYEPEDLATFEVGAKTDLLDNRLRLNGSVFFNNYDNKQEDVVVPDLAPGGTTVTLVQNAAKAKINGAELEFTFVPADGLTFNGSVGYLDAKYDDYTVLDLAGNTVDKSGLELRRAPKFTSSFGATYEHQLDNGHFIIPTINYSWRDDYAVIANNVNRAPGSAGLQEAYGLLDASLNYETDKWRLSLFAKNLTNEDYFLHVLDVASNYSAASATDSTPVYVPGLWTFGSINPPRTWGVELDVKF